MLRASRRTRLLALACLAMFMGFAALAGPHAADAAGDTTWICKPGQADDLCAGTIDGTVLPPPGQSSEPLGYTRPENPPIDCFYLYPTQSEQPTPNSNLEKDPPIRRVVVQQARMFSTVCNVYAPMYRQVTYSGNQIAYNPDVETAYTSAKAAFEDYLQNYNQGRGFIMIGHSQGSAHTARLIDELVDPDAELRQRFVGAIAPGANVYVPIGKEVGGMYANVPACSGVGQYGCLVAFSTYDDVPGPTAAFSRLDFGYWIYPESRPDPSQYEAVCTNPAQLDGGDGTLRPLVNFDYLFDVPAAETASPWRGQPDFYRVECKRQGGAHWLNLSRTNLPGDTRADLGAVVASGSNYHVPEVNLAEGNLLTIAGKQSESYLADKQAERDRVAALRAKLKTLRGKVAKAKKRLVAKQRRARKLAKRARRSEGKRKRALHRRAKRARKGAAAERRRIKSLKKRIVRTKRRIG